MTAIASSSSARASASGCSRVTLVVAVTSLSLAPAKAAEDLSGFGTLVDGPRVQPTSRGGWAADVCAEIKRLEKLVSEDARPADRGMLRIGLLHLEMKHCGIDISKKLAADQAALEEIQRQSRREFQENMAAAQASRPRQPIIVQVPQGSSGPSSLPDHPSPPVNCVTTRLGGGMSSTICRYAQRAGTTGKSMRKSEFELGFPTRGTKVPVGRTLDHGALTMKFAPESHLKMADLLQASAKAASGTKKRRLEGLACAHEILAKRLEATMKSTKKDAPEETAIANVPLMTHWLREPPGAFSATLEWEQYLTELRSLPDSIVTRAAIQSAEEMVAMKRAETT